MMMLKNPGLHCMKCGKDVELCNDMLWNGNGNADSGLCSDCKKQFFLWTIKKFCEETKDACAPGG
ncbi:MAG: hypothetical protein AAB454_00655 [Patescibacteria group bacterium]